MSEQPTPYNQIDFVIQAPRFRIVFSYMDDKGVAFVREYLLRLLKLTPCKPEQIAQYFGFNQRETKIALADLESNKWIEWQDNGLIALSAEGLRLFSANDKDSPKIPTLKEFGGEYRMELLDNNFLQKKDCDTARQNAIELSIDPKILSESQEIARQTFQNRFIQLVQDDIVNLDDKDISLYKIDAIENKGKPDYFRFTQAFELLPETGEAKERHDITNIIHQYNIQQAITAQLEIFAHRNNLDELQISMDEIKDNDTPRILSGENFNFKKFLEIHQKYDEQNSFYFLGQIYHQSKGKNKNSPNMVFDEIELILNKLKKSSETKKLYWLAPSDVYWGKQRKIHDKIQNLVNQQKDKNYDFRLYLPLPSERNRRGKQEWQNEFNGIAEKEVAEKTLYGFCEGFLNGNTEILFLQDEFAVVCYHAKLSAYPVSLPIGFMTKDKAKIKHIQKLVESYLSAFMADKGYQFKDLGLLSKLQ